jgi:hypothetical protein
MDGLERRKRLTDLLAYGCGFNVPSGTHARVLDRRAGFSLIELLDPKSNGGRGWAKDSWLKMPDSKTR